MSNSQTLGRHRAVAERPARSRHAHAAAPRRSRRRVALVVTSVVAFSGAGTAIAAWLVMGSGSATGKAISAQQLQVTPGTASPDLYPGAKGAVTVTVTNPNPFAVRIDKAAFRNLTVTPLTGSTCTASDLALAAPVTLATPVALAAADAGSTADTATVTVPDAIQMLAGAQNGCQGASFTVIVDLTGESAA